MWFNILIIISQKIMSDNRVTIGKDNVLHFSKNANRKDFECLQCEEMINVHEIDTFSLI